MKNYRYCLYTATIIEGVKEHPQEQMEKLGYKVIKAEPVPIADSWFFRVENEIENTPNYLFELGDDFAFWSER